MIIEGKGVTKHFGGLTAVDNVDFGLERGGALGLIGPNGAGKTTLFNLISAAIPVSSGVIRLNGQDIQQLKSYTICRLGIARTFQTVKIFPNLSVLQNVELSACFGKKNRLSQKEIVKKSSEMLEFVGLSEFAHIRARDVTLGNQKKLEVARALATDPELLLLDEVMAGLNQTEVGQSIELISEIRKKGITIIMIEHVMKAIMSICEQIMVLHHGAKIAEGTPDEISNNQTVIDIYFGGGSANA